MKKLKSATTISIWERDRNREHGSSPDYYRDINRRSLRIKSKFPTFRRMDGEIVAYNLESIFKYKIEEE